MDFTAGKHPFLTNSTDGASYAFTELNLEGKGVESFGILLKQYEHLRKVNLNKNKLREIGEIDTLPYLVEVIAQNNLIKDIDFFEVHPNSLQYLRVSRQKV